MLDDPRVNFAISNRSTAEGLDHLGIQVDSREELKEIGDRLVAAGRDVFDRGEAHCCYAHSDKGWVADPQGIKWETFFTFGQETVYGDDSVFSGNWHCGCGLLLGFGLWRGSFIARRR